ncbi:MAG TPA: hypothetical protein VFT45_15675 [Longimicrobium sp.]|nr:hypothetical protein [Longimicrobium sp.]
MSGTPEPDVPLGAIREAARGLLATLSERAAAASVGMSQAGFRKFLEGSKPQTKTRETLKKWYQEQVKRAGSLDPESAAAAIELLVCGAPQSERANLRVGLLRLLRSAYGASGNVPEWLRENVGVGTGAAVDYLADDAYPLKQGKPMKNRAQTRPRERDANLTAFRVVQEATADDEREPPPEKPEKDPSAVALGRRGGVKGGKARAANLTPEERSASARRAAAARWAKKEP